MYCRSILSLFHFLVVACFACGVQAGNKAVRFPVTDVRLPVQSVVLCYNFFQPVKQNLPADELVDSLEKICPGEYAVVCKGLTQRSAKKVLTERFYLPLTDSEIFANDSLFNRLSTTGESGLALLDDGGKVVKYLPLLQVPVPAMAAEIRNWIANKSLPDSLLLHDEQFPTGTGNVIFLLDRKRLLLFNLQFNALLVYDVESGELKEQIAFDSMYSRLYLQWVDRDTQKLRKALENRGIFQKHHLPVSEWNILSIRKEGDLVLALMQVYFIKMRLAVSGGEDTADLLPVQFLVTWPLRASWKEASFYMIHSADPALGNYKVWYYSGCSLHQDSLFLSVYSQAGAAAKTDSLFAVAGFRRDGDQYRFHHWTACMLPDYFQSKGLFYGRANGLYYRWQDSLYYVFQIFPFSCNLTGKGSFLVEDSCYYHAYVGPLSTVQQGSQRVYQVLAAGSAGTHLCLVYQCNQEYRYLLLSDAFEVIADRLLNAVVPGVHRLYAVEGSDILELSVYDSKTLLVLYPAGVR